MGRRRRDRLSRRVRAGDRNGDATTLLSVNGELRNMYMDATDSGDRAHGYAPVEIGEPLMVRYLHFYLKHADLENKNELMISTFLKTEETKRAAAEAINFFDGRARFTDGSLTIRDFGGEKYGHPLIYYSKAYRGESLYLTTRIMELDSVDGEIRAAINQGVSRVGSFPMFAEFLPFIAVAKSGAAIITGLVNLFNRDDQIVRGHDCDLHFGQMHARRLQSGRLLCVPRSRISREEFIDNYRLRRDNVLVAKEDETAYTETSYFVIQVDAKKNRDLENFDHFVGAADLLAETNRGGTAADIVNEIVGLTRKAADIDAILEMEGLSIDAGEADVKKEIKAIYKSLSPQLQKLYEQRAKEILDRTE